MATKPADVTWPQLAGAGVLCGIFTLAFFIAELAFHDPRTLELAEVSVLAASVLAAVEGTATLRLVHARWQRRLSAATQVSRAASSTARP